MTAILTWIGIVVAAIGPAPGDRMVGRPGRGVARSRPGAQGPVGETARIVPGRAPGRPGLPGEVPAARATSKRWLPEALAANVALAYRARGEVPWGASLPDDVFLDAVLPHVSVTEPRESMRAEFHDRYLPLVRDCKRPGEAALALNKALFRDYKVVYNTRRLRTDQCSKESIKQGMATCTGLSIMLVEACRAVGVPARLAGIAAWPGRGGNHTWICARTGRITTRSQRL